jgi:hypothetical protein
MLGSSPATQDSGVAALDCQCSDIDGHVWASLVNGSNYAERNPHLLQLQTVWQGSTTDYITDWVWQFDNLQDCLCESGDSSFVESKAILQTHRHTIGGGSLHVLGVACKDRGGSQREQLGNLAQNVILDVSAG